LSNLNKKNNSSSSSDKNTPTLKGLSGVLIILEKFFDEIIQINKSEDNSKKRALMETIEKKMFIGKKVAQQGTFLANKTTKELDSLHNILSNVPYLNESFKLAQKGLKGVSDLAEEATVKIQDSNTQIQDSLDQVDGFLTKLDTSKFTSDDDKRIFEETLEEIRKIADISFNIMVELQFQDILRQQLSAINTIISKTKVKIADSLQNITGVEIEIDEEDDLFAATDDSVLTVKGAQDEVDKIIAEGKNNKE